jgi:hypothetical protein
MAVGEGFVSLVGEKERGGSFVEGSVGLSLPEMLSLKAESDRTKGNKVQPSSALSTRYGTYRQPSRRLFRC